ncbi:hypothetical protein EDC94DRAFT_247586 [Helicostylum pulchrum]|nr:hypothetical protein EDC94DRAFT_247586 [Helicostylum pulchrum]
MRLVLSSLVILLVSCKCKERRVIYIYQKRSAFVHMQHTLYTVDRVYSTSSDGSHFFTVCYKIIDNKTFLVRIDNLNNSIRIITSDMEKARKILRKYPKTVYACYKKTDNSFF